MNFYNPACEEPVINKTIFGLCDDQTGAKAYTSLKDQAEWIATVKNGKNINLIFTAIDKCVLKDGEEPDRGRCDGMLTSAKHIYFVELKDQRKEWKKGAIDQLESTVKFFIEHHDLSIYTHKKAFACNKKSRNFQEVNNELNLRFFRTYGVRIDVQAEIIIV